MDLMSIDFKNLTYKEKQAIIENLKKEYDCQYGYVDKNHQVIKCSYGKLIENLRLATYLNQEVLLVIQ